MKIAVIGLKGLPSKGGGERVGEAIVRRLAGRHQFTVYCDRNYTPADAVIPNVKLMRLPTTQGKHTRMLVLDILASLHALFLGGYDLVHIHHSETGFVIPLLRLRYKVVSTSHSRAYTAEKWGTSARIFMQLAERLMIRFSNSLTCVTPILEPFYSQFRQVTVIPNGIDLNPPVDLDGARKILSDHQVVPGEYILFAAGRIIPLKGCHLLIEAFKKISTTCKLVVVGDLSQMAEYGEKIMSLANDRVVFIPFIQSPAEVAGIVKLSKLFVFPSTNEAMSLMLLEVAALGTPLLCSDIPSNQVVLEDKGYYFESGKIDSLETRLTWAIENMDQMQKIADLSKQHVIQHFCWDTIADQYNQMYQKTIADKALRQ